MQIERCTEVFFFSGVSTLTRNPQDMSGCCTRWIPAVLRPVLFLAQILAIGPYEFVGAVRELQFVPVLRGDVYFCTAITDNLEIHFSRLCHSCAISVNISYPFRHGFPDGFQRHVNCQYRLTATPVRCEHGFPFISIHLRLLNPLTLPSFLRTRLRRESLLVPSFHPIDDKSDDTIRHRLRDCLQCAAV